MTVGIAALTESASDEPKAIVAADRMVTIQEESGVEYEDSDSKLEPFIHNDELTAIAVGSGSSTYIDEMVSTLREFTSNPDNRKKTARDALRIAVAAYQHTVRETINNRIRTAYKHDLNDLEDDETTVPAQVQQAIVNEAKDLRERAASEVTLLVTAVGADGGGIFKVAGGDFSNLTDVGYATVGSGSRSARLTFTRRQYNSDTTKRDGLFTVLEAKRQAEERQGVGQRMDLATLKQGSIRTIDKQEEDQLWGYYSDIQTQEERAREKVMKDAPLDFI